MIVVKQVNWNSVNILRLGIPMMLGYITSNKCWSRSNGKKAGSRVAFRPPAYVFGIVWPILYIMLGLSWVLSDKSTTTDICYISTSILLASWIYVYGCKNKKIWGIYSIVLTIGSIIMTMNIVELQSRLLIVPLLTWLLLALLLNVNSVENDPLIKTVRSY